MGWRSWPVRSRRVAVLVVALLAVTVPAGSGSSAAVFAGYPPPADRAAKVTPAAPPVAASDRWGWPLQPVPAVVRPFEAPPSPWAAGHRGVDLDGSPGQHVLAPAVGVVTFSGVVVDRGVLVVAHPAGLRTSYEPVQPLVEVGTHVAAGDRIALLGPEPGHCAPLTCLHWGLRHGSTYVDPLPMVRRADPPVLLPLGRP
ncbi:MAG TPA: M23 family metallopeptidase [Actinomycetales bacterium]|nr:M23 family metallopeptidase [Actinomycetales bacterium]